MTSQLKICRNTWLRCSAWLEIDNIVVLTEDETAKDNLGSLQELSDMIVYKCIESVEDKSI
jgi:hypothetical protein